MTRELHPEVKTLLDRLRSRPTLPPYALSVTGAREAFEDLFVDVRLAEGSDLFFGRDPARADLAVETLLVPGSATEIPVRVYDPDDGGHSPVLTFFNGGGWVRGGLDTHDHVCREVARRVGCIVVSVAYRRPPEHPFPAALVDAYDATEWVANHAQLFGGDPDSVAVGGTSAGGNLAATTSLLARDRGGPAIRHQLLIYPVTDHSFDRPSYEENVEGYLLTKASMQWYWDRYLASDIDGHNPYASPLQARDLAEVPPATVLTCEFDPLRDEGRAYARRLREAGVPVTVLHYDDVIHAFVMFDALERATEAFGDVARELEAAFSG